MTVVQFRIVQSVLLTITTAMILTVVPRSGARETGESKKTLETVLAPAIKQHRGTHLVSVQQMVSTLRLR